MSTNYLLWIGAIVVAYLVFMYGLRHLLAKKPAEAVTDLTADEAMKQYLGRVAPEIDPAHFRLLWGSTFANTDITRIYAYNAERICVIPAKVAQGELVMPVDQPAATIELREVDHIWFGRKDSLLRMLSVDLFFGPEDDDNRFQIWCEKKDVCGNDNRPEFRKFIDFLDAWAKQHNIPTEDL